ncbi:HAD-IIIC family phosphatase [Marinifilum fragile]|uniref:HAD-IIIC family phosphatase n=1 Tax=Marinifilum fragile TaxID=570161 RepID=UPI002AA8DEDF|nr:HAD-IIIC family phosphatase [Marinifilum fragile]
MKYFIFRNSTIEPLFNKEKALFSGYADISYMDSESECFIWFYVLPYKQCNQDLVKEIEDYYNKLLIVYNQIPKHKFLYVFTLLSPFYKEIVSGDFSIQKAIHQFNMDVVELSKKNNNIRIIDFSTFGNNYTSDQLIDWKYYFISQMPISPKLTNDFNSWFKNKVNEINLIRKKCLVLDLDNTLWGGILGEDGINGIQIGGDYPGNVFLEFQKALLELKRTGVILTVCSKNNEQDVIDVWEKNPFLLLRNKDFSAYRINWNNKVDNIKEIAQELNIGLDSIVFIDDNPVERELVRQLLPSVETPEFPAQVYSLPFFINTIIDKYFGIYNITAEDKVKTEQYVANKQRVNAKNAYSDLSDYIKSLEIEITLQDADSFNFSRIAQLTQKTNQFNLTTKRYVESEIIDLVKGGSKVNCISVKDKFGDSGITGVAIIKLDKTKKSAIIDSFLLSCRILGRGIEDAFILSLLSDLKSNGINTVYASYLSSPKNKQVSEFYEKVGFEKIEDNYENCSEKSYKLNLSQEKFEIKPYYNIIKS